MSKPSAKKLARQKSKQQQREQERHRQQSRQGQTSIAPTFPAEQLGAPTAFSGWFGQKVRSIFRLHR